MRYINGIVRVLSGLFWLLANVVMFPLLMGKVNGRYKRLSEPEQTEVFNLVFRCMTSDDANRLNMILGG